MRLVDADEAYKVLTDYYHHKTEIQHKALKEAIERVPTVDAVEVVRCKDCKYYYPNMESDGETGDCKKARWYRRLQYPSDYCSRGERREDGNT